MNKIHRDHPNNMHVPVLSAEVLAYLNPKIGESYLDLTAGYGGHAQMILDRTRNHQATVLVDRDGDAIDFLKTRFAAEHTTICHSDFLSASRELVASGNAFDIILADFGLSSPHLNESGRGFSFSADDPLDMRMDQSQDITADEVVNTYSTDKLVGILRQYGEEPKARLIARLIVEHRPISTTTELANIVKLAWPGHSRVHPATRSFQAIRIAVNEELMQIANSLPLWLKLLKPDGRIVVISFHSLEDRLVKQAFLAASGNRYDSQIRLLTKRPVQASKNEVDINPRARSAKLRAAVKIKIERSAKNANRRKGTKPHPSGV
jgi:16S rRNA (cytosine1402-N4)-methyltransferase